LASKENTRYAWLDGKRIREKDACAPIITHSMQYGSGVFEGIRAYKTPKGTAVFRLPDHVKRFFRSAKIYGIDLGYSEDELLEAVCGLVKANKLDSCYIRPFAFYNDQRIGLSTSGKRISVFIAAVPFGAYFGGGKESGIKCKVSSWNRINSSILPPQAKGSGNYLNSIIASAEAKRAGADEAILLSTNGYVAEGPGENIVLVRGPNLVTPSKESDILLGITRDSVIRIAESAGLGVVERNVHREELYTCDELFFTGTAAELTPILSVDSVRVGNGKPGPMTKMLAGRYSNIAAGLDGEFEHWLTYI
jgi:branched-chain amino acid aminotransferase